ncbi:hypothetical protein V500_06245 [Pseudogymnoascus sp. VKM F-4518 (FW-2643)]|nr:hypothetical protein V500_06245 [Pseudogymnoascus sp. VKM F-4518 (FW-2643)]
MPPISEERKKVIAKGMKDAGISPDYFESFTKVAEGNDLDNVTTYNTIIEVAKTIQALKDLFKDDFPAVRPKLAAMLRQLQADDDRRKGKTGSNNLPFRLDTAGPMPFNTAAKEQKEQEKKQEKKPEMNQGKKREAKQ